MLVRTMQTHTEQITLEDAIHRELMKKNLIIVKKRAKNHEPRKSP